MYELDYQDYLIGLIVGLPGLIYVGVMYELDYQDYLIGLIVGLPGLTYWINCWITWINICWSDVRIG